MGSAAAPDSVNVARGGERERVCVPADNPTIAARRVGERVDALWLARRFAVGAAELVLPLPPPLALIPPHE